jgi:hypothetical protein
MSEGRYGEGHRKALPLRRRAETERFGLPEGKTWDDVKWGVLFLAFEDGTFDSLDYDKRRELNKK